MTKHIYRQKHQTTFMQGMCISALCVSEDMLWVGTSNGLYYVLHEEVNEAEAALKAISRWGR